MIGGRVVKKELEKIAQSYKRSRKGNSPIKEIITNLYNQHLNGKEQLLTDIVTSCVALNSVINSFGVNHNKITPQMEEAFTLAYPNLNIGSLGSYNEEQLSGIMQAWKGKYFEVQVRDSLNTGEWIGDLQLEAGQTATLAESPTQSGWDLQILNEDGNVDQLLQLKATDSLSYIKSTLEENPEFQILATEEVLKNAEDITNLVIPSNIRNDELRSDLADPFATTIIDVLLPGLPFAIIALGEGRKVLIGKQDLNTAVNTAIERSIKSGVALSVGTIVYLLDGGLLSVPSTFLTRIGIDRVQLMHRINNKVNKKKEEILTMNRSYNFI
jgi:hypothetical protein